MHENMKTSMWHTGRSERTWRLPACFSWHLYRVHRAVIFAMAQFFVEISQRISNTLRYE